jgi:hypothetical protein
VSWTYYPQPLRLDGATWYLLWASSDEDTGLDDRFTSRVYSDGRTAVTFADSRELQAYSTAHSLELAREPEGTVVDFDAAAEWAASDQTPDPVLLLACWNLCVDVAAGTGRPLQDRSPALDPVYDKLFFGNNLPSMTPPGEHFEPSWSADELATLRTFMRDAIEMLRTAVGSSPTPD